MQGRIKNLSGHVYGRLTVSSDFRIEEHRTYWKCICACGNTSWVLAYSLKVGSTTSCGCFHREMARKLRLGQTPANKTHGKSRTATYTIWIDMIRRCTNPKRSEYPWYGGRGISVCQRWMCFENFFADMGERPRGKSLDRLNNDLGYCKENCEWRTSDQQANNKSINRFFDINGERLTLSQVARKYGIHRKTLEGRVFKGISIFEAIARPVEVQR